MSGNRKESQKNISPSQHEDAGACPATSETQSEIGTQSPALSVAENPRPSSSPISGSSMDICSTPSGPHLTSNVEIFDNAIAGAHPLHNTSTISVRLEQLKPSSVPDLPPCLAENPYGAELTKLLLKRPKKSEQSGPEFEELQQHKEAKLRQAIKSFVPTEYQSEYIAQPAHRNQEVLGSHTLCPVKGCNYLFTKIGCGAFHFDGHSTEEIADLSPAQYEYFSKIFEAENIKHFKQKPS